MTAPSRKSTAGVRPRRVIASRSGIESANLDGGDGELHDPVVAATILAAAIGGATIVGLLK